ncbi:antitoxin of toxin-antitoxin stability system [Candidatus Thiodictyon syntrophicum]|uniref:Antitoxin of toxin-antitoxin stability system n=2 Tax=Candidatus Thiodictyon syntrophicum TaxID=1166950 RepID=A0A2K8UHF0_9GAMM|nr:antitoxin of toxin-antitoxin stability system [Candidatus Thiodictyon syntrophicum]
MMRVSLNEAQARLPELVKGLASGDEVLITDGDEPVARLVSQGCRTDRTRQPGSAKGKLRILVDDDAHLDDFRDYVP